MIRLPAPASMTQKEPDVNHSTDDAPLLVHSQIQGFWRHKDSLPRGSLDSGRRRKDKSGPADVQWHTRLSCPLVAHWFVIPIHRHRPQDT